MAAPQPIRNIVFDIGWVLVRLDYRPLLGFLQAHGAQLADRAAVMTSIRLEEHETGQLPGQGLLERLRGLTRSRTVSLEETRAKWLDMFELEPAWWSWRTVSVSVTGSSCCRTSAIYTGCTWRASTGCTPSVTGPCLPTSPAR